MAYLINLVLGLFAVGILVSIAFAMLLEDKEY